MSLQDDELIQEFVVESGEHLQNIESQLLAIEAAGADINSDLVNQVFRAIHSIKGAAGFLGLSTINKLSHVMENVLNRIRNRDLIPTRENVEILLKSADMLRSLLDNVGTSNERDVSEYLTALERVNAEPPAGAETSGAPAPSAPAPLAPSTLAAVIPAPVASPTPPVPAPPISSPPAAALESAIVAGPATPPGPATPAGASAPAAQDANIRVPVSVVDALMNLASELVLSRNQLLQAYSRDDRPALGNATGGLDRVTSELQEAIMRTRMQPVGAVLGRFPRLVRDLSGKLGKHVELQIDGKEVEVDKTIIEAIGDPLTHLIRNSIDHGVELPAVREQRGKKSVGHVHLRAYHQAGKVRIDIEDDGGGIDPQRLRQKAIHMGVLSPERAQQMRDRDAIQLIFHPGLSTAAAVTDVSGRGVGMDVVKTNIEKLGGSVDVESTLGVGTIVRITLPLTLAIIPSLIVRCRDQRFAIPQLNIIELVRVRVGESEKRINRVKNSLVLRLRDTLLPLVRLNSALGWDEKGETGSPDGAVNIIVVESSDLRYGLIVDGLHDSEEIVVKPLGKHIKDCNCLAGATILGDGHVALILDIDGISRQMQLKSVEVESDASDENNSRGDRMRILLFSNDPTEQFAIPMPLITRIERIRADQIDAVGGQEILQFRGSTLPLLTLEGKLHALPRPVVRQLFVVVFNLSGREVGLIAPALHDIQDIPATIDAVTFREPGVAGSFVFGGKAARLLDVYELARANHPDWFVTDETVSPRKASTRVAAAEEEPPAASQATILLAEDSPFFRKQVMSFLKNEGFEVIAFEDGRKAWDFLTTGDNVTRVDLIVTDIEMPVMTGLQLCRHVKDHPRMGHLPVIALTTLAGDEDVQRGLDAGVNEYQIKMDREQLIVAVRRLLREIREGKSSADSLETCRS